MTLRDEFTVVITRKKDLSQGRPNYAIHGWNKKNQITNKHVNQLGYCVNTLIGWQLSIGMKEVGYPIL